ncbi:hypothetical protein [Salinimicrobium gaetbulicola]|uniref:Uncharacterized protein n=1 Tax=Salinimicrobium gaetbulicola TaxID=999702 RepID=A0ABW3IFQ0_9FLAO
MEEKKDTVITVTVDTEKINLSNINQCVVFTDNRDDPSQQPGDPENYVSTVDKNMKAIWEGVSENGTDSVQITNIDLKGNDDPKILKDSHISSTNGIVEAKIKDKYESGEEAYKLTFTINNSNTSYPVDPKLRMSTE